jgi:hypothetical protein
MNDVVDLPVRTNLDLHFGRLSPCSTNPAECDTCILAARRLLQHIANKLLRGDSEDQCDTHIQCHVFDKKNALPAWLVNKTLVACDNTMSRFENTVMRLLRDRLTRRRFLDYICGELTYYCWEWSNDEIKRHWIVKRTGELSENNFCQELNSCQYVIKLNSSIVGTNLRHDSDLYRWYISSLGSINLLDFTTKPIYEYTARLLEAKYKTSFILDVFKKLFANVYRARGLDHWGLLVLGDIPKLFCLADFLSQDARCQCLANREPGVTELLCQALNGFDAPEACPSPEARFRLGTPPPQALAERVGAMFWLDKTLTEVKRIQQQKATCQKGLRVEERSFLTLAMKQQCILYFHLFEDQLDPQINPCSILSISDQGMVLQSPKDNKLNSATSGQEIHGYFSIVDRKRKSTYCDFRTSIRTVRPAADGNALVEIAFPASVELTRRTHKRLHLDTAKLKSFSLIAPPNDADWPGFGNLESWPEPLCLLPDANTLYTVQDLSAGGLMLAIHQDAPAFDFFDEDKHGMTLLALLHLAGHQNMPDLRLPLRLEVKRIRHFAPTHAKYLGVQFTEVGEIKNEKYIRWQPVGKEGVFLIADWIFRNTICG